MNIGKVYDDQGNYIGDNVPVLASGALRGVKFKSLGTGSPTTATHNRRFKASEFVSDFVTGEEFDAFDASVHPMIKKFVRRLTSPNRDAWVSVDDPQYAPLVGLALSEGILTQERHDEYLLGIPE